MLDRLFSVDRSRYPIQYGRLRESLSIGSREGIRFLSYILHVIEQYTDVLPLSKQILYLWTGLPPEKFSDSIAIDFFITDQKIASVLTSCLRQETDISTVHNAFLEYKRDLIRARKRTISTPVLFTKEQMVSYVQDSINEMLAVPLFLLAQAYEAGIELFHLQEKVAFALSSIEKQVSHIPPGLVDGAHGMACELAISIDSSLIPRDPAEAPNIPTLDFEEGIAGISYFLLSYAEKFGDAKASSAGQEILFDLIEKAVHKGGTVGWGTAPCSVLPFLKGYEITGSDVYRRYAESSLYEPPVDTIKLGGIYQQMYHILRDSTWLMKTHWIVQTQMRFKEKDMSVLSFILDYAMPNNKIIVDLKLSLS